MTDLRIAHHLADGLYALVYDGNQAPWHRTKARATTGPVRKCVICDEPILPGQIVYAPIGNMPYRMKRFHATHLDNLPPIEAAQPETAK